MVTHIVLWKLIDDDMHPAEENAQRIKRELEALVGVVPGLLTAQVGQAMNESEYDLCLLSTFENSDALREYRTDPAHVKAAEFVRASVQARTSIDFESDNLLDSAIDPYVF